MSNLLDSASIVLTPTAYDNGKMLSVKPNTDLFGAELVTNGDFATDSNWVKGTGWTISNGLLSCDGTQTSVSQVYQFGVVTLGTKYQITFSVSNYSSGTIRAGADGSWGSYYSANGTYTYDITSAGTLFIIQANSSFTGSIDNVSVKEDLSGDFDFSRNSAATRVNAQGLVENVQILSGDLVSNGDFSQEGVQEVSNGSFSQEGAEEVRNGDFSDGTYWSTPTGWSINNGTLQGTNVNAISATQSGFSFLNKSFRVEYTITEISQGDIKVYLGGSQSTPQRSAVGTYVEYIDITSANATLYIQGINNFTGKIDNVSVKEVGQDWSFRNGLEYWRG